MKAEHPWYMPNSLKPQDFSLIPCTSGQLDSNSLINEQSIPMNVQDDNYPDYVLKTKQKYWTTNQIPG